LQGVGEEAEETLAQEYYNWLQQTLLEGFLYTIIKEMQSENLYKLLLIFISKLITENIKAQTCNQLLR
jgi:hypothetical protein